MAKVEIYDIGLDALHQLFPNEGEVKGARVGDYFLVCWGGYKEMLFPAPAILKCHDRETAVELAVRNAAGDFEDICNHFMGWALDYEVWHVVDCELEPCIGSFYVSLSNEVCDTPNDVRAFEIGYAEFSTYDAAERFAIRNVCESIPSVLVSYYDHDADERFSLEPLRFLRWVGGSSGHGDRFGTFTGSQCPQFCFPTKNGSIYETLSGLLQLRKAGDR